jgi:hypothetical protein
LSARRDFTAFIRAIPDHPKGGVMFRDITTLLRDARALGDAIEALAVESCVRVDLPDPGGRFRLEAPGHPVHALVSFPGD